MSREATVEASDAWDVRAFLDGAYLTLHVAAMGFTLVLPLLGAAFSGKDIGDPGVLWRLAVGASYHVFVYALNDVCDLPIDRTEPGRADDPLVRGIIGVRTVLALALVQLPILTLLWIAQGASPRSGLALAIAVVALAAYDRWGKALRVPMLTDLLQGLGWAALLVVGVPDEATVNAAVIGAGLAIVLYILLVNGIVGPVRDLANDHASGARTTAIALGVRPDGAGVRFTRRAAAYAIVLHAAYFAALVPLLGAAHIAVRVLVALLALASTWLAFVVAPRALRRRAPLARIGGGYIGASLGALVAAGMSATRPATASALFLAFVVPVGLMFARNRRHWT